MESALVSGVQGLFAGVVSITIWQIIMLVIASVLLYLGIKKGYEPLLLVPIGFGAILVNIPLADMMGKDGFLRFFYDAGVLTEVFPLLIFIGIGAMTDFQPLLQNPENYSARRCRPVRHIFNPAARSGSGVRQTRCRRRCRYRRMRRTDGDLR